MNDSNCHIFSFGSIELGNDKDFSAPDLGALPILATRNLVLFPGVTIPLMLVRDKTQAIAKEAAERHIPIGICCQLVEKDKEPESLNELFHYGVIAHVLQVFDMPDGTQTALIAGRQKFRILGSSGQGPIAAAALNARVKIVKDQLPKEHDRQFDVTLEAIKGLYHQLTDKTADEGQTIVEVDTANPEMFVNIIATNLSIPTLQKMEMLGMYHFAERLARLHAVLTEALERADIANDIREKAREGLTEQTRNAFLHQQLETIRTELYGEDGTEETAELAKRADALKLPVGARKTFDKELEKLKRISPSNPDYSTSYSYLETLLDLPWGKYNALNTDFSSAEEALNAEHYGLEKVKERILEQMAVMMNNPEGRSPIICLVGAPGVGKTSLGQSIAKALGREYQRVSLGGLHDEAEIRGHRRTYIGAMPGRIIEALRRCDSQNPVLLLDEVDKVGHDYKGDPSAALLEVLDPEQNCHFHDNYIDVDFDLSKVLFIATANTLDPLSQPLLDRMEIIDISGYVPQEKIEIAKRHLLPRVLAAHKVSGEELTFDDEALRAIIDRYTRESGVRQLEKALAKIVRKAVLKKMRNTPYPNIIRQEDLKEFLGMELHQSDTCAATDGVAGVATGLAWTVAGGEIMFIEASPAESKTEKLTLTGNLGEVMKESASIAMQYVRAHAQEFGIEPLQFNTTAMHIHAPEGAIRKDGPSAGITMATAIVSAMTHKPLRPGVAMTGEITLRGRVLPVGGIKEKLLAAKRAGATDIILSEDNKRDVEDITKGYLDGLAIHYVTTAAQAIRAAL